jgi:hypothetical protein
MIDIGNAQVKVDPPDITKIPCITPILNDLEMLKELLSAKLVADSIRTLDTEA